MAIPFHDRAEDELAGVAAYLKVVEEPGGRGLRAALFCMSARGEPIEFTFSRVDLPSPILWRSGDQRRRAVTALCRILFTATSQSPTLLLVLAGEVPPRVFAEDLDVTIPVARLAREATQIYAVDESPEPLGEMLNLFWTGGGRPPDGAPARTLIDLLSTRDLLLEPFERAACGLEEAYQQS